MELSWLMRIRVLLSAGIGILLVGLIPWGLLRPELGSCFALFSGSINIYDLIACLFLCFSAGFVSSAVCTPYGFQIGIISAPCGMAVWALRSAPLSAVFQHYPQVGQRLEVYSKIRFEGFVWLVLVLAGFAGAFLADKLFRKRQLDLPDKLPPHFSLPKMPKFVQIAASVIGGVFVSVLFINIFAAGINGSDPNLGKLTVQPSNVQIAFAVFVSFGICGFLARMFLSSGAIWPAAASAIIIYYSATIYIKETAIATLLASWPPAFFTASSTAVLPIYAVCFGFLGSVWGYWLAVRYNLWRLMEQGQKP